jgi:hypothetical protein
MDPISVLPPSCNACVALDFDGVLHAAGVGPDTHHFPQPFHRQKFLDAVGLASLARAERARTLLEQGDDIEEVRFFYPAGTLFERETYLKALLERVPSARLVIATSWRSHLSLAELKSLLAPEVASRVAGVLPYDGEERTGTGVRGRLMEAWMTRNAAPAAPWIALDDQECHYRFHPGRLVLVPRDGLTDAVIRQAAAALGHGQVPAADGPVPS